MLSTWFITDVKRVLGNFLQLTGRYGVVDGEVGSGHGAEDGLVVREDGKLPPEDVPGLRPAPDS